MEIRAMMIVYATQSFVQSDVVVLLSTILIVRLKVTEGS